MEGLHLENNSKCKRRIVCSENLSSVSLPQPSRFRVQRQPILPDFYESFLTQSTHAQTILYYFSFFFSQMVSHDVLFCTLLLCTYKSILEIVSYLYIKILSFFFMVVQYSTAYMCHDVLNQPLIERYLCCSDI